MKFWGHITPYCFLMSKFEGRPTQLRLILELWSSPRQKISCSHLSCAPCRTKTKIVTRLFSEVTSLESRSPVHSHIIIYYTCGRKKSPEPRKILTLGGLAQMVERSLSMWKVRGSMPRSSIFWVALTRCWQFQKMAIQGLEPWTFALLARRSNQLSYTAKSEEVLEKFSKYRRKLVFFKLQILTFVQYFFDQKQFFVQSFPKIVNATKTYHCLWANNNTIGGGPTRPFSHANRTWSQSQIT